MDSWAAMDVLAIICVVRTSPAQRWSKPFLGLLKVKHELGELQIVPPSV